MDYKYFKYYKYHSRIGKMILKLIDEPIPIDSEPKRIKRTKGSKTSLSSYRKNYFTIRAKTYDRLQKLDHSDSPSQNHFHNTFNDLRKWNIITEDPDKKEEFKVTDLGHICNTYNYDPKEYLKLHLVCAHICFRAATGILRGIDGRTNDLKSNKPILFTERETGITPEDVLEYKSRIYIPQINANKLEVLPEEMNDYIDMLKDLDVIKKIGYPGHERYVLNQKYKEFILKSNTIIINLLKDRMEFKWAYIHRPIPKELEWYQAIFGIQITKGRTSELAVRLMNNKKKGNEEKKKWKGELLNYDTQIIADYEDLKKKSADLDEIPGFIDTIISFGCQKDLIELITLEHSHLLKELNP
jgi:hypothetical protein